MVHVKSGERVAPIGHSHLAPPNRSPRFRRGRLDRPRAPITLGCERLESRLMLDGAWGPEFREVVPRIVSADHPANHATFPGGTFGGVKLDGVADLLVFTRKGTFRCTGSLLATGLHVLTAAHCVQPESLVIMATFHLPGFSESIRARDVFVHPSYHPAWLRNDIAIIELAWAPSNGADRYGIYRNSDEVGQIGIRSGYGRAGIGDTGDTLASGRKRWGGNVYDRTVAGGTQLLYDFDNGQPRNNALGGLGLGMYEVNSAPGDSGAPTLVTGLVAGVASYATRSRYDIDNTVNSSFGEISADTRVSVYAEWIDGILDIHVEPPPDRPVIAATYYLSTAQPGTLTNSDGSQVMFDDSDVLRLEIDELDAFHYSVFFDGSAFGLDDLSEDIDALHMMGNGDLIVSTTGKVRVPGIRGLGADLLRFDGNSRSWSLVLEGRQVGLNGYSENIDAVTVFESSGGDLSFLISTSDRAWVPGLNGVLQGQDLLLFDQVSGTWDVFMDGSDVGLSGVYEDIDAIHRGSVSELSVLLSTRGGFKVPGLSGWDEDVARLKLIQTGSSTVGNFDAQLAFDGSDYGLGSFDVDALYVPSSGDAISDSLGTNPLSPPPSSMIAIGGLLEQQSSHRLVEIHDRLVEPRTDSVRWSNEPDAVFSTFLHANSGTRVQASDSHGTESSRWNEDVDELFDELENELLQPPDVGISLYSL